MNKFCSFYLNFSNNVGFKDSFKVGDFVVVKFIEDGEWYRVCICFNDCIVKVVEVVYIDYGNIEKQLWFKFCFLSLEFNIQVLKVQVIDVQFLFVQFFVFFDYFNDVINYIYEIIEGKQFVGSFDFIDFKEGVSYIMIYDFKVEGFYKVIEFFNCRIIEVGWGFVLWKFKCWESSKVFEFLVKNFKEVEKVVSDVYWGMWEYGEFYED